MARRRAPLGRATGPREVLDRWRAAVLRQDRHEMEQLYASDAVHEFPFAFPGVPSRLTGREEILDWVVAGWNADVPRFTAYRTLAVHDTADPATIVVEQDALGTSAAAGEFTLPNIVVLTVHDGQIVRLRDYVGLVAAAAVLGRPLGST